MSFRALPLVLALVFFTGCESAYYSAMEQVGVHKRDILVDRVDETADAQESAKEEFRSALELFTSVVEVPPSDLKDSYQTLAEAFEDSQARADLVSERIDAVESVSAALFDEWAEEIDQISNARLRSASAEQRRTSERQYSELIAAMRRAEGKMQPVLVAFRDQVLFLKHNLNAQAISSLQGELGSIRTDVAVLISDMEASIAKSQAFIEDMELLGGRS